MNFFPGPTICLALMATASLANAQSPTSPEAKSTAIAASFSKTKDVRKEKRGGIKSKYVKVVTQPAALGNPADYSGKYEVADLNFALDLRVNRDGSFTGTGHDPLGEGVGRTFTLRNGKIQGALLTATKVYADGRTEPLEGAFMNRTRYESPTDKGVTVFGFGTIGRPVSFGGYTTDKFFYQKQ
jgi:hypothetical protein